MQAIYDFFSFAGKEVALLITSMTPIIELRGAIPLGAALGMGWTTVFFISVIGNLIPVPFIILFGKKIIGWLKTTRIFSGITHKFEDRLMRKSEDVLKYSAIGLCLFVAVPLPGTGAWSGAAIAALLNMSMKYAIISIAIGVAIAGVIMTLGSYGVLHLL
ncbi:COG2426 family protein [Clostridium paraputrificum]|uniref:COG2426 family protein n=1 Tax=Clostridium TaxID=1485 RepID=UPI003D32BD64